MPERFALRIARYTPFGELRGSIRLRLTLWYVSLLGLVLVAFSVGVYFFLLASISTQVSLVQQSYQKLLTSYAAQSPKDLKKAKLSKGSSLIGQLAIYYQSVNDIANNPVRVGPVQSATATSDTTAALLDAKKQGCHEIKGNHFACTWLVFNHRHQPQGAVDFQGSLAGVSHAEDILRSGLIIGVPLSLLIALLGGWALASRALSPLEQLRQTAQSITATDLSRRIGLHRDDELGRLAGTLDGMIAGLDSAFREQRRLTADVSHELRTPLSVIQAQASLALKRVRSPQEYAKVLGSIQEETERMSGIVEDLLLLARADAGQEMMESDPVRLDVTARWAADSLRTMASEKDIELAVSVRPVMIDGDQGRLRQLCLNLIHNAVKYTNPGGKVKVRVYSKAGLATLKVTDSGDGIDEHSLPHIFERFYMVDRARARSEGGSGLGLSIVHWIVEAHGGAIAVESKPGSGSTFTVRIPLHNLDRTEGEVSQPRLTARGAAGLPVVQG
jgi:heavy metal sensor kinase